MVHNLFKTSRRSMAPPRSATARGLQECWVSVSQIRGDNPRSAPELWCIGCRIHSVISAHQQVSYGVRFEWGLSGARAVSPGCELAVVVDVLSFTTTLSVALDAGIAVLPDRFPCAATRPRPRQHEAEMYAGYSVSAESMR